MPRVSVIVPVYNVEAYVASCLESVRRQTLSDIEIVCVNDGSTDRSLSILKLCQQVDSRIVIVDKENGGLSSARNAGIDAATGEYVCFLDSDDLLERNACERIARAFDETGADVVTYGASAYPLYLSNEYLERVLRPRDVVYEGFDLAILKEEASWPFAWRTACRREFLDERSIRFDEAVRFGEDAVFHFALYPQSRVTAFVSDSLLKYRVSRPDSLMGVRDGDRWRMAHDHVHIADHIFKAWTEQEILDEYRDFALDWVTEFVLYRALFVDEGRESLYREAQELWSKYFPRDYLEKKASQPGLSRVTKIALGEEGAGEGSSRWFAAREFESYLGDISFARAIAREVWGRIFSRGLVAGAKKVAKAVLPLPTSSYMQYREEDAWDAEERFKRQLDLDLLVSEVQAVGRAC